MDYIRGIIKHADKCNYIRNEELLVSLNESQFMDVVLVFLQS